MVRGDTHVAGNRLDLVMTDAPDSVYVSVVDQTIHFMGSSDLSFDNWV